MDLKLPVRFVHMRDVEMNEEVVQAGGRHIVAQRLERHAAVPRGKRYLFGGEAAGDRRTT